MFSLSVLDSTGKPSSGILEGGFFFIGFYSECLSSVVNINLTEKIYGQYCSISFNFTSYEPQVSKKKFICTIAIIKINY